jgi:hypothetical protein
MMVLVPWGCFNSSSERRKHENPERSEGLYGEALLTWLACAILALR